MISKCSMQFRTGKDYINSEGQQLRINEKTAYIRWHGLKKDSVTLSLSYPAMYVLLYYNVSLQRTEQCSSISQ